MSIISIRGVILEEVVIDLLRGLGYSAITSAGSDQNLRNSGLELKVRGRGEWHQIDALASFGHTPPFIYPLRLIVEAKCLNRGRKVGIGIVRNSVGVLKDISENHFSTQPVSGQTNQGVTHRYNYVSAIFSTGEFTREAVRYAEAHQIFLIQYEKIRLLVPIIDQLHNLIESDFNDFGNSQGLTRMVREFTRHYLLDEHNNLPLTPFSETGIERLSAIKMSLNSIGGSYFGMLQGRWPVHLFSASPLPIEPFIENDTLECRIYGLTAERWSFVPLQGNQNDPDWFRLEFDLPKEIFTLVREAGEDRVAIARTKQQYFSYIALSGMIGGIRRQVTLKLSEDWINSYIDRYN